MSPRKVSKKDRSVALLQSLSKKDNATERVSKRVELDEDSVAACCKKFGCNLLERDLLPHQKKHPRYCLRFKFEGDSHLSTFQRSFTDNMRRKNLGSKQVAIHIW
jgi:hypothetical protein